MRADSVHLRQRLKHVQALLVAAKARYYRLTYKGERRAKARMAVRRLLAEIAELQRALGNGGNGANKR